jgi:selenocysteine lyase/cysteine desulfurase
MIYNFMRGLDNIRIIDIPDSVDIGTFNKIIQNRIPIVSFQVLHNGVPLHYNLIVKILSDRFGILTRGGVQCCPLFAQKYLHGKSIENVQSKLLNDKGLDECYGFVRLSLNYLLTDSEIKKILEALQFISKEAYKFSGYYNYNCKSNLFS